MWLIIGRILLLAVLKGISDGLSRGKKPEEMEKLVKSCICHDRALLFVTTKLLRRKSY